MIYMIECFGSDNCNNSELLATWFVEANSLDEVRDKFPESRAFVYFTVKQLEPITVDAAFANAKRRKII